MLGTVKFFEPVKFFGFIGNEGGEWFFHGSTVIGKLPQKGDEVEFWLADGTGRHQGALMAVEVSVRERGDRRS
jgi:cold shock CspA family protein